MIYLSTVQLLFVIIVPIVVAAALIFFLVIPLAKRKERNHFEKMCYRPIYRYVKDNDFYLINNFEFKIDDTRLAKINHILFSDKFIYVIFDKYVEGSIVGNYDDASHVHISKSGNKDYIDNQFQVMSKLVRSFCLSTNLPTSFMIGITVINNDCAIKLETKNNQLHITHKNELIKLIKDIEKTDVAPMVDEQLAEAVQAVSKLNRRK